MQFDLTQNIKKFQQQPTDKTVKRENTNKQVSKSNEEFCSLAWNKVIIFGDGRRDDNSNSFEQIAADCIRISG